MAKELGIGLGFLDAMGFAYATLRFFEKGGRTYGKVREQLSNLKLYVWQKGKCERLAVPLGRDVRSLKSVVSQLRKSVLTLQRIAASQQKELEKGKKPLEAAPEEVTGVTILSTLDPKPAEPFRHYPEGVGHSDGCHSRGSASVGERAI